MDKKQGSGQHRYIISFVAVATMFVVSVILFAVSVVSLVPFLILLGVSVACLVAVVILFVRHKKKQVEKVKTAEISKIVPTDEDLINLYNLAGIPVIYDENGKIKNIYELLDLEVLYDDNGGRIKTIYEILGIVPRFDKNGKEIPTILSIKNRVNGFIKPKKMTSTLKRVLTQQEKEELLLKQMLEQKLKEANASGDENKAKAITKVIAAKKKEQKKPSATKTPQVKLGKGSKPIKADKVSSVKIKQNSTFFKELMLLSGVFDTKQKKEFSSKPPKHDDKPKIIEGFKVNRTSGEDSTFRGFERSLDRKNTPRIIIRKQPEKNTFMGIENER